MPLSILQKAITTNVQAIKQIIKLKGGVKLSTLPKITGLDQNVFQALNRYFNPLKSSSISLPPNTPKNDMR